MCLCLLSFIYYAVVLNHWKMLCDCNLYTDSLSLHAAKCENGSRHFRLWDCKFRNMFVQELSISHFNTSAVNWKYRKCFYKKQVQDGIVKSHVDICWVLYGVYTLLQSSCWVQHVNGPCCLAQEMLKRSAQQALPNAEIGMEVIGQFNACTHILGQGLNCLLVTSVQINRKVGTKWLANAMLAIYAEKPISFMRMFSLCIFLNGAINQSYMVSFISHIQRLPQNEQQ